jgi:putative transposase
MAKPYSTDLRERVVARVLAGDSIRAVGATFDVSPSAVSKWSGRFRTTGSAAPGQMGGHKPLILTAHRDFIQARFTEEPELTLRSLQRELSARGIKVSYGALWTFVHAEGLSFKKNRTRRRAGSAGRCPKASAMEEISGAD